MIPAALLCAAVLAAPADELARLETAAESIDPRRALLRIPSAPDPTPDLRAVRAQLDAIERDLRKHLETLNANDDLLTDPALRQTRSDLAVGALTLRLPTLRARLTALDPDATEPDLAAAIADLAAIDYAWGDAAARRRAALAALLLRAQRPGDALAHFEAASAADPLVRTGRVACRAAAGELRDIPSQTDLLEAAIFGAALGPARAAAASELAERALASAPAWAFTDVRTTVYATLTQLSSIHGARPPMLRVAIAESAEDLERILANTDGVAAAEARWRLWTLTREWPALRDVIRAHPNPAARAQAANLAIDALATLSPRDRAAAAAELRDRLPDHPHAGRWLLMHAEGAPVEEALAALDANRDASIADAALLLAARRAREAFDADPEERASAERLVRRAAAARAGTHSAQWIAWLVTAEAEGRLRSSGAPDAGAWALRQPREHAEAAAQRLAPAVLGAALEAEAQNDRAQQTAAGELAAALGVRANRPIIVSRARTLAGDPSAALEALGGVGASSERDLARAEALFHLGRDEEAFPLFRAIAESHEANRRESDAYWRSWSRLLQIVARQEGPSRSEEIAREINRLRIQDERLGGDPHRRRLESLLSELTTPSRSAR